MTIKWTAKQLEGSKILTSSKKTRILFDGGRRSGKTLSIMDYIVSRCYQYPGSQHLIARLHLDHARTSIWSSPKGSLSEYLSLQIPKDLYIRNEGNLEIRFPKWGDSVIRIAGMDDKERTEKILGTEYQTIFLNESSQMSYETYQMASTSAAQRVKHIKTGKYGIPKVILDCNPRGPRHWLHQLFIDQIEPISNRPLKNIDNYSRLHWSAYDNKENLSPEFLRELEGLPNIMRLRMLDGIWANSEGLVYSEFDYNKHVKEKDFKEYNQFIICADIGFTAKTAIFVIGYNSESLHVYQEIYTSDLTPTDIVNKIKELQNIYPINKVVIDKSAKGTITQAESMGVNVIISNSDIEGGIMRLKELLIKDKITFSKNCEGLLKEFEMYSYKDGTDKPEDKWNDALDSLRYGINLYFDTSKNIEPHFVFDEKNDIDEELLWSDLKQVF